MDSLKVVSGLYFLHSRYPLLQVWRLELEKIDTGTAGHLKKKKKRRLLLGLIVPLKFIAVVEAFKQTHFMAHVLEG